MKLVAITVLIAVCGAAKLDRTYLPPSSAATAGGNADSLQTPLSRSSSNDVEVSGDLPTGSYTNSFQGVVVDAATAGTRASPDEDQSGLGGPRDSYGSSNSKVGDAAFRGSIAGFRNTPTFAGSNGQASGANVEQNFGAFESKSERPQSFKDRNSNIISYANDVSLDNYSYGFESDNGISVGENGVANNGIQAQGGYSYKGDDGQVYKVTYVADEGGYRPQGAHLPTPPPIPKEILVSLEQNAKDEAAGLVDDGSYDAKKYNAEGDYTHHNGGNIQYNGAQLSQFAKRPESDATASSTFINQNSQAFGKPQLSNFGAQSLNTNFNAQFNGNKFESNNQNAQSAFNDKQSSQINGQLGQHSGSQFSLQTQNTFGNHNSQFDAQKDQQASTNKLSTSQQSTSATNQVLPSAPSGGHSSQFGPKPTQVGLEQFDAQATKPSLVPNPIFNLQQNLVSHFGNQEATPQGFLNSPVQVQSSFEKPVQPTISNQGQSQLTQSQFGISTANKPSETFSLNKPSVQSQSNTIASAFNNNGNGFSSNPNQLGAEYLPPFKPNDRPSYNSPQTNHVSSSLNANSGEEISDFIPLEGQTQDFSQGSSASAFASVRPAGPESKPVQSFNNLQSQPARPNQFHYNNNNQVSTSQQTVQTFGTKPTAVPDTELTTPLETNEKPSFSQATQFNSQSSLINFGSTLSNQSQTPISSQNTFATQQSTGQSSSPSLLNTLPEPVSQFGASPTQAAFPVRNPALNSGNTQSNQNVFAQNQQNAYFSTQNPSNQGSDDSYYYNQPSEPFDMPIARPNISRFPSSSSYQSNGVASLQNNQFINQQSAQIPANNFSSSIAAASPTSASQTQTQGIVSTSYYNGVTQAAISPFPSVSPTHSSPFDTTQRVQFGSKPILNQPVSVFNKPTGPQLQNSAVSSFPSKQTTNFEQNPSLSFIQSQTQFGQGLTSSSNQPTSIKQSFSHKPTVNNGPTLTSSFTQNQIQNEQTLPNKKDQPESPEINLQQNSSTQQYEGTIYEYNKPAEVLPPPEQSDSSSNQSTQSDSSSQPEENKKPVVQKDKPQSQSESQAPIQSQFNLNHGSQTFKPFGNPPINHSQFAQNGPFSFIQTQQQNTQDSQGTLQSVKPNGSLLGTSQFGQTQQSGLGFVSQIGTEPAKLFDALSNRKQFGQNNKQTQNQQTGFISSQTQNVQSFRPSGSAQSPSSQFEQKVQNGLGVQTQNSITSQLPAQSNKPFESTASSSQFGLTQAQGSQLSSFSSNQQNSQLSVEPFIPFGTFGSDQVAQPVKPFGTSETSPGFQGYPSSRPPFGSSQLTHSPFSQTSPQTFGSSQIAAQPTRLPQADALPTKPSFNAPIFGSQNLQFGQNTQLNHGNELPSGSAYGQYFQGSQFGSTVAPHYGPQYGVQAFGQNPSSVQPFGSASSQAQFGQNSAQASSSASTQPGTQIFKPFGVSSIQSSFQNKPQIDQAPQSSLISTQSQGVQPFSIQSKPSDSQNKPSSQAGCCGASKDSAIAPLNVGKPSQAFGLTQSQFIGFQGAQGFGAQTLAGKGEQFGGPRQPPSFDDQTGYHY